MTEGWRDVPGFEGHYRISTFGRVMSVKNGDSLLMKIRPHSGIRDGKRLTRYMIVELRMPGKRKKYFMHVLMAAVFIPNPENLPIVNHEDGNTFNFALTNLKWVTRSDNAKHSWWRKNEPILQTNDDTF